MDMSAPYFLLAMVDALILPRRCLQSNPFCIAGELGHQNDQESLAGYACLITCISTFIRSKLPIEDSRKRGRIEDCE
jgi:hypothetical protein